jgi:hypothetical protein
MRLFAFEQHSSESLLAQRIVDGRMPFAVACHLAAFFAGLPSKGWK